MVQGFAHSYDGCLETNTWFYSDEDTAYYSFESIDYCNDYQSA